MQQDLIIYSNINLMAVDYLLHIYKWGALKI